MQFTDGRKAKKIYKKNKHKRVHGQFISRKLTYAYITRDGIFSYQWQNQPPRIAFIGIRTDNAMDVKLHAITVMFTCSDFRR